MLKLNQILIDRLHSLLRSFEWERERKKQIEDFSILFTSQCGSRCSFSCGVCVCVCAVRVRARPINDKSTCSSQNSDNVPMPEIAWIVRIHERFSHDSPQMLARWQPVRRIQRNLCPLLNEQIKQSSFNAHSDEGHQMLSKPSSWPSHPHYRALVGSIAQPPPLPHWNSMPKWILLYYICEQSWMGFKEFVHDSGGP